MYSTSDVGLPAPQQRSARPPGAPRSAPPPTGAGKPHSAQLERVRGAESARVHEITRRAGQAVTPLRRFPRPEPSWSQPLFVAKAAATMQPPQEPLLPRPLSYSRSAQPLASSADVIAIKAPAIAAISIRVSHTGASW